MSKVRQRATSQVCTCGVRLAVVLAAVLHLDGRQAEGLDHLVSALAPVRGAECQDGEGQSQSGQGQGEQGAGATGHVLQHGHRGTMAGWGRGEEGSAGGVASRQERRTERGHKVWRLSHRWSREARTDALVGWVR